MSTDRPSRRDPPMTGLEVWLIGTPAELNAASRALAGIGHVIHHTGRIALIGGDTGRHRTYARIRVTLARPAESGRTPDPAALPTLAA